MLHKKVIVFFLVGILTCASVFGQDIAKVKEFERAKKTISLAVSLNFFGFGIGSLIQGDTKATFLQLGISTVGYAFLLSGLLTPLSKKDGIYQDTKDTMVIIGGALMGGNALIGAIRPTLYQFDEKFDTFYDIDNEARWPAGE